MASSSSSNPRNEKHDAFSVIEPHGERRRVDESSRLFDVFINHRGPDAKQTVALQLYRSLEEMKIKTYLDSEEKELGDSFPSTIENAIHSASVHIAIFSKGYAESPWCLMELVFMLQSSAKIIPLFYGVKPSDLRYIEKGVYAAAFTKYEEKKRYMEKLKEWKEALQSVSLLTGHEISSDFSSDCQSIMSAVQNEVQRKKPLCVAKHPVGLHKLVEDFERACFDKLVEDFERECRTNKGGKEKAQIVGMFGMGGVGKTTLAKELFNRNLPKYKRACFLFDVREAWAKEKFPSLQSKLLKDLFERDGLDFHFTEEGKSHIGDCIGRSNQLSFLIVVDDIDHVQQLDALLIMEMLEKSSDSLVIATTRDVSVLINAGITAGYNLKGMDRDDARELFCWHAFRQPNPANNYENLVNSFLNVCGGLPLSLQVLGSHVHCRDQKYWTLELNKVSKTLPRDIRQRLKISFDALDYEEQQIFMDIACFFVDELKSIAMGVWEASGWSALSAQHALETLKNKCLVQDLKKEGYWFKVGEDRSAWKMHDHLRDMGREIANGLNHPRRLWRPQDLQHLGFQSIIAQTKTRCFYSIPGIGTGYRFTCFLGESDVNADISTCLLWLNLEYEDLIQQGQLPSIPSWIPLQNLRLLIIRNLHLKTLWQSNAQAPTQLKELQIHDTYLEEYSDFLGISNSLEKLTIDFCKRLKPFLGLSVFRKLMELSISYCSDIQELSVDHLNYLEKLILHNCDSLKTVSGLSDLGKLIELNISNCSDLQELSVVRLSCLEKLILHNCCSLNMVSGLSDLRKLIELNISNCSKLQESSLHLFYCPELKELSLSTCQTCLAEIRIVGCGKLLNITLPTKLEELRIEECKELKKVTMVCDPSEYLELQELSSFVRLSCLKRITIKTCEKLQTIQIIDGLHALQSLHLSYCPELKELSLSTCQTCLAEIRIVGCGKLQNITLPTKLEELIIEECKELKKVTMVCDPCEYLELQELSSVVRLSCLKRITIQACEKLQTIQIIDDLHALQSLHLFYCPELKELSLSTCQTCLAEIGIVGCGKLLNITLPTKLEELRIEECKELKKVTMVCDPSEYLELQELSSFVRLSCLKQITIKTCEKLKTIQGIDDLHALQSLHLFYCPELKELSLSTCQTCLAEISIVRCGKLQNITLPTKLEELIIEECKELKKVTMVCDPSEYLELQELSSVARLSCLKRITIQACEKLQTIQVIDDLHALQSLHLFYCPELKELSLSTCQTCLAEIRIVRCGKLQNITLPTKLEELIIEECKELKKMTMVCDASEYLELQELSTVVRLSCLKRITIKTCEELQIIQIIDDLHALQSLHLFYCPEVKEPSLSTCQTCLAEIRIVNCGKLQNITLPTKLEELIIEECKELKKVTMVCDPSEYLELQELSSVARLSCLKRITIQACEKLQTIQIIDDLHALQSLHLFDCPELKELSLSTCQTCLAEIRIVRCGKLQNITLPTKLEELIIEECKELKKVTMVCDPSEYLELQELSSVAGLSCLKQISIQACEELQIIQGIDELHAFNIMQLSYCSNAIIRNYIPMLKSLPSKLLIVIGRPVDDGALSTLKSPLFSDDDAVIEDDGTCGRGQTIVPELSALILCFVVELDSRTRFRYNKVNMDLDLDFDWQSVFSRPVERGEWLITVVLTQPGMLERYDYHKVRGILQCHARVKYRKQLRVKYGKQVRVKKGEEWKTLPMLRAIIDRLYWN